MTPQSRVSTHRAVGPEPFLDQIHYGASPDPRWSQQPVIHAKQWLSHLGLLATGV